MELQELTAISPVDGRYRDKTSEFGAYFSEFALIRYRIKVEIEYFIELTMIPLPQLSGFPASKFSDIRRIYEDFSLADAQKVKDIEKVTNHDVKAVEYYIKEQFDQSGLSDFKEFIHFGLTSQDINNTSVPLSIKDAVHDIYHPVLEQVLNKLNALVDEWADVTMLARTHGQPASPTRLGKEIYVFVERMNVQLRQLDSLKAPAKFGGATGNYNAHSVAYPDIDWPAFGDKLVNEILGLQRSKTTTQVEHYDNLGAIFDVLKRVNIILLDLCKDIWAYVSMDYFKQKIKKGEVGSSAMPHKVNPIDFENAEGNLGIANALFEYLTEKLPVSRLQRDLTDSTVLRNVGVPMAHTIIAFKSILKGLNKLLINKDKFDQDLENNWSVVAEAIQTILRREGYENPYEALKELTRTNDKITHTSIKEFIETLDVSNGVKEELKQITPYNYTGVFRKD
jgi:adenylosuccinate lyase